MRRDFKGKSIILGVPDHFGLPECFRKNLEYLGLKVYLVPYDANAKSQLVWRDYFIHGTKKIFLNNRTHKAEKIAEIQETNQLKQIEEIENVDYSLIIRPDLFSKKVLQKIKEKSSFSVGYQWDGMGRFPLASTRISYFDKFYVFDKEDTKRFPNTYYTTNFYFDYISQQVDIKQDVFFIGTLMKDRMEMLVKLSEWLKSFGLSLNMTVVCRSENKIKPYKNTSIRFQKTGRSFENSMLESMASNILIDVENTIHKGLSFRCFEAVGFSKKLITNNRLVKNYDFYDENNIFVVESGCSQVDFEQFINKSYKSQHDIASKYSFSYWFSKLFC
ncbi:hypothetical protein [Riemerella anatipestifer]|uniref:hypothetical protein n=1 Tax=Riemerella anatipestifer TaxID=34085 RepID=UPI001C6E3544|nr:hypothetical protein [Riemerella anatipestifer]MCW0522427.1 hypothetical protein [Riemerella anatipestifer]QYQ99841.1 hypothetical protein J6M13_05055 [Riemerella anatipestifer]